MKNGVVLKVSGMSCNHCKTNIENNLRKVKGLSAVEADINVDLVIIKGEALDIDLLERTINGLGYNFNGVKDE